MEDHEFKLKLEELQLQREQSLRQFELESLKIKWISGGVAICLAIIGAIGGWATGLFDYLIKDKGTVNSQAIKEKEIEKDYIDSYINYALDKNLRTRQDFAVYVSTTANSDDVRKQWSAFLVAIKEQIAEEQKEKKQKIDRLTKLESDNKLDSIEGRILRQEIGLITDRELGSTNATANAIEGCSILDKQNTDESEKAALLESAKNAGTERWMKFAIDEIGVMESQGSGNNCRILEYFVSAGHPEVKSDKVSWSSAFIHYVLKSAGYNKLPNSLLNRSWLAWGERIDAPYFGAIAVFSRTKDPNLGHVGFYLGETKNTVQIISGNSNNSVSIAAWPKDRLLAYLAPVD